MSTEQQPVKTKPPTFTCELCGGRHTKGNRYKHILTAKHRRALGEDIPKATRKKKENAVIGSLMLYKVAELTPEEAQRRREYCLVNLRRHRAKKKAEAEALEQTSA